MFKFFFSNCFSKFACVITEKLLDLITVIIDFIKFGINGVRILWFYIIDSNFFETFGDGILDALEEGLGFICETSAIFETFSESVSETSLSEELHLGFGTFHVVDYVSFSFNGSVVHGKFSRD